MTTSSAFPQVWDLESLYPAPDSPPFAQAYEETRSQLTALVATAGQFAADDAPTGEDVLRFVQQLQQAWAKVTELEEITACYAAADASNVGFQRMEGRLTELRPLVQEVLLRFELFVGGLQDGQIMEMLDTSSGLRELSFFIQEARRNAGLRLPAEQEVLYQKLAVNGLHAWSRLYDRISGDLRVELMEGGIIVRKSPGQVRLDSPERSVRENNFRASEIAWRTVAGDCTDAINHMAGMRLTHMDSAGLQDHLDQPLRLNRMKRETLAAMWDAVAEFTPRLGRFLDRRAEMLGLEQLSWFDMTAPLPLLPASGSTISWDDGCQLIVDCFRGFSPDLADFAAAAFANRWIEAVDRDNKRQGGFCTSFPLQKQARIFMTFTDSWSSVSTLAHELGHAYHSHVLGQQPYLLTQYPMNLAETASTFAECVLARERLSLSADETQKIIVLDGMLEDAVGFLMNIRCRFLFEDAFHSRRKDGELSTGDLDALMTQAQQTAYEGKLAGDGMYPQFWVSKLHFYISTYPFYNFPYTFGYLLSLALFALADEGLDDFPASYRDFLVATGCQTTEDAINGMFGFDPSQPALWQKAISVIDDRLEQFLSLTDRYRKS